MNAGAASNRHAAFRELPRVAVGRLRSTDLDERRRTADHLVAAARAAGFLYVTDHGIERTRMDALVAIARRYFVQPAERKLADYIGRSKGNRGYVPEGEEVCYGGSIDRKEAFDLSFDLPETDPDVIAGTPMLGPNVSVPSTPSPAFRWRSSRCWRTPRAGWRVPLSHLRRSPTPGR